MQPFDRDNVDHAMDVIKQKIAGALDQLGRETDDQHREMVSVPVEYVGSQIIRSKPYESPRHETGTFEASLNHIVGIGRNTVSLWHYSSDPKSAYLHEGTDRMARRPSFDRILNYWELTALSRFSEIIGGSGGQANSGEST